MDLTYSVPREAYIDLLAEMIRQSERRPLRVFTTMLLTVGQMAVVILLCIFRLEAGQRSFALIWSLLVAGITLLRRLTRRQRAKGTLMRLEDSGQLPADYWKPHRLHTVGQELRLSYGGAKLSCPLSAVTVREAGEILQIYCEKTIFDLVPADAFRSGEARARFVDSLRAQAKQAKELPAEAAKKPESDLTWTMEEKAFEDGQYLAYHTLYYRYRFLRPATFVRLAVCVAVMIGLMRDLTTVNAILGAGILAVANLENISMIPFICRLRIRREVGEWRGSREYRLSLREDEILFASDRAEVQFPVYKINLCEEIGSYFIVSWNNFPAVVLPKEVLQTAEGAAVARQIRARYGAESTR